MGVPKFFRYISERYPCLSELVRANKIPEFDNLYLDMNGIIHVCSHPNDNDVHFRISEEKIFKDIFQYLEVLFLMIKPRKLFFMAIDGVAPRAKMNQQRGRRFRSAKDAEILEQKAKSKGEVFSTEARFDSNCITPGTEFMSRLDVALKYFIKNKISTSTIWQNCKVIYSGHETPGEGEHKIMDYIRYLKSHLEYDLDTRHCLYGLDADLIMLGLCTHEKHFSLLREEVKFGKQINRAASVHETRFFLLHLSLMRDYLELEFDSIRSQIKFKFDIENIIDDWILMGFLVGNDFIPHLPNMHINSGALPLLYNVYMEALPQLEGYINDKGKLNLERFEIFMKILAKHDRELFMMHYTDLKYMDTKLNAETFDVDNKNELFSNPEVENLVKITEEMVMDSDDNSTESDELFDLEFEKHKASYYIEKMGYKEMNETVRCEQTKSYIEALQWILYYYYRGVPSWSWFYEYHYSPFISDIHSFKDLQINFQLNKPFLPFEQLLSVLPTASKNLLPSAYHELMTDKNSKIAQYYPTNFETDLNGKKQEWEAVVLIPFIDENLLLQEMRSREKYLNKIEIERNTHGPMYEYQYNPDIQGSCEGFMSFPTIVNVYCSEQTIFTKEIAIGLDQLPLIYSRVSKNKWYYKGFPTLKNLTYKGSTLKSRVKVFDQPSRNESMIISLKKSELSLKPTEYLAQNFIGKTVYVGWPHLSEAKVIKVSNTYNIFSQNENGIMTIVKNDRWKSDVRAIQEHHINRLGIDVGEIQTIFHVVSYLGYKYLFEENKFVCSKTYSAFEAIYPAQAIVDNLNVVYNVNQPFLEIKDVFQNGTPVFMNMHPYYGLFGEVIDAEIRNQSKRIKVLLTVTEEPELVKPKELHYKLQSKYVSSYVAASKIGISENTLLKITDNVYIIEGYKREDIPEGINKINIGLQIKSRKNNEVTVGYVKKHHKQILFSEKAIDLVAEYFERFPKLFNQLDHGRSIIYESELFNENIGKKNNIQEITDWLKQQDHYNCERRSSGTETVEKETIPLILDAIKKNKNQPIRRMILHVKPTSLYVAKLNQTEKPVDENVRFRLFDRVTVVSSMDIAPIGYKGTIIGVHCLLDVNPIKQENINKIDLYYDVLFDKPFTGGLMTDIICEARIGRIHKNNLMNLTYGKDLGKKNHIKESYSKAVVTANTKICDESHHQAAIVKNNDVRLEDKSLALKQILGISCLKESSDVKEDKKLPLPPPSWKVPVSPINMNTIITCDNLEQSLSKKSTAVPLWLEKSPFVPLQAITGRKNSSFKISHRQPDKKGKEIKSSQNSIEQTASTGDQPTLIQQIKPRRLEKQSRLAAKFNNHKNN
uniref:5'-3' exoribonuclease 1 n=1 Tax=Culicoides sonorensis TaxID=179676 RepID=A0A336LMV3_CULSO